MTTDTHTFITEELQIPVADLILSGTLTIPSEISKPPVVILLSGYGPSERDFEGQGLEKFRIISSHFSENGIASFRYDDRGAGKSSPVIWSDYTFYDLADEVLEIMSFLKKHPRIDSSRIGLLGHSLGAAIAPIAASQSKDVKFLVLLGVHGLIGTNTGSITRKYIGQALGESNHESEKGMEFVNSIYNEILADKDWEQVRLQIRKEFEQKYFKLADNVKKDFSSVDKYLKSTYEGFLYTEGNTPMFRSFLRYDPSKSFSKIKCPSLLLFAELDTFHPPEEHKHKILEVLSVAGNENVTVKEFPQTSHEFTTTDSRARNEFATDFLSTISEWIVDVVNSQ